MDYDLHNEWTIESLHQPVVEKWIRLPLKEFDPENFAARCNDENDDECFLNDGLPFACPFKKVCTEVTPADWENLVKNHSYSHIRLAKYFKAPEEFFS